MKLPNFKFDNNDLIVISILCLGVLLCWLSVPSSNMQILNTIVSGLLGGWTASIRDTKQSARQEKETDVP